MLGRKCHPGDPNGIVMFEDGVRGESVALMNGGFAQICLGPPLVELESH
jgi:hypothetical protein